MNQISRVTRFLQSLQPQHPLKGLTRFGNLLNGILPPYQGVVQLPNGAKMRLDSRASTERWLMFSGSYHPAITAMLHEHTPVGAHCLDIGANLGFYTLMFAAWAGKQGRVAAFEANPAMQERVRENVKLSGFDHVEIVPKAVDQQPGMLTFYIASDPGKSSISADQTANPTQQITVEAINIDEYMLQVGWNRLDVIKSDIEGNDCRGLLGAKNTLERFRPVIIFEYWFNTPIDAAAATFNLLAGLNYRLFTLQPNGEPVPFSWRTSPDKRHVDVICIPSKD